jgi:hypothetical protein
VALLTFESVRESLKRTRVTGFDFSDAGIEIDVAQITRVPYCSACPRRAPSVYDQRNIGRTSGPLSDDAGCV